MSSSIQVKPIILSLGVTLALATLTVPIAATAQDSLLFQENFDDVIAPALPSGWLSGQSSTWETQYELKQPRVGPKQCCSLGFGLEFNHYTPAGFRRTLKRIG